MLRREFLKVPALTIVPSLFSTNFCEVKMPVSGFVLPPRCLSIKYMDWEFGQPLEKTEISSHESRKFVRELVERLQRCLRLPEAKVLTYCETHPGHNVRLIRSEMVLPRQVLQKTILRGLLDWIDGEDTVFEKLTLRNDKQSSHRLLGSIAKGESRLLSVSGITCSPLWVRMHVTAAGIQNA